MKNIFLFLSLVLSTNIWAADDIMGTLRPAVADERQRAIHMICDERAEDLTCLRAHLAKESNGEMIHSSLEITSDDYKKFIKDIKKQVNAINEVDEIHSYLPMSSLFISTFSEAGMTGFGIGLAVVFFPMDVLTFPIALYANWSPFAKLKLRKFVGLGFRKANISGKEYKLGNTIFDGLY